MLGTRKYMNVSENIPDPDYPEEADSLFADELQTRWKDFVQRVRVHEMLKCMRVHYDRLKIVGVYSDIDELLLAQEKFRNPNLVEEKKGDGDKMDLDEDAIYREQIYKRHEEILTRGIDTIYLRTQAEEEEVITAVYPSLKKLLANPTYVSKCIIRMFRKNPDITEREFESVLELCQDRLERQALVDAYKEMRKRQKYLKGANERRHMLYDFVNSRLFTWLMLITIMLSTIGIILQTFESIFIKYCFLLILFDSMTIGVFLVEATLKIALYRVDYFKGGWNLLDMLIIITYFIELLVEFLVKTFSINASITKNMGFRALLSLRSLRLIRVIKFLPSLQIVVSTIFQSMLAIGSIAVLMLLFIFVFAVTGVGLFHEDMPGEFGNTWFATVTLFQLLTMDDWFKLMQDYPIKSGYRYWTIFTYLSVYIVIENLVFLNLFVAVLVDNFQLTLSQTSIKKRKEALIFLEQQEDFLAKFEELDDTTGDNMEQYIKKLKAQTNKLTMNNQNPEMTAPDYFPLGTDSRERAVFDHIFKDLSAIDFQRFLYKRRLSIINTILDSGITSHRNTWQVKDNQDGLDLESPEFRSGAQASEV